MEILRDTNIDFMKYRKIFIGFSLALVAVGIFSIFVHGKLNVGIDFAGGTQITLKFKDQPDIEALRQLLRTQGIGDAGIQRFGAAESNEVLIRTRLVEGLEAGSGSKVVEALDARFNQGSGGKPDLNRVGAPAVAQQLLAADPDKVKAQGEDAALAHYQGIAKALLDQRKQEGLIASYEALAAHASPEVIGTLKAQTFLGSFAVEGTEAVGPQVGAELRRKGYLSVVASLIGMLIYIWFRFELRFGVGAIMACLHDILVTLGLFALAGYEFNLTTVAAFLTLVGYSVNDSVVIFDRIRENLRKSRREPLIETMNKSLNQTLSRTILTGGSTLLALTALLIWGGEVIRGFAFVMTIGILVGTYSSIYVACPFTLLWDQLFGARARPATPSGGTGKPAATQAR